MDTLRKLLARLTVDRRSFKKRFLFAAFIDVVFAFSVFLFIPYEMFLGNISEFRFAITDFWMPLAVFAVVYAAILLMHACLKGLLYDLYTSFVFGGTAACYIQSMFLNGTMQKLDETGMIWDAKTRMVNLVIWLAIVFVPLIIRLICKKNWRTIFAIGSLVVFAAQASALVLLAVTTKYPVLEKRITDKGLYEVSAKNNVIIFCLDTFDNQYIDEALIKYPDLFEKMPGFTRYPNAVGKYSFTHIAVPYLLTGNAIPEYDPTEEQYLDQINNSEYYDYLAEHAGNFGVYTEEWIIKGAEALDKISNAVPIEKYDIDRILLTKAGIRSSLYKVLPFQLKKRYEYSSNTFNKCISSVDADFGLFYGFWHGMEAAMSDELKENGLTINEEYGDSCFRFIHVQGLHEEFHLDKNADLSYPIVPREDCVMGELTMVNEYCMSLEKLGLFEDATIIVTADHGVSGLLREENGKANGVVPIFFYKPAGVGMDQEMKTSNAPVDHSDILATVFDAFGQDGSRYGYVIDEIPEDMDRTRYFYYPLQDPLITDRESCIHVEYAVRGDARSSDSWQETGNRVYPNNNPRHGQ